MRPLVLVPARQFSEGVPCKNRQHWPALIACVSQLPLEWPVVLVTDDPWIASRARVDLCHHLGVLWHSMDAAHTVSQCVVLALERYASTTAPDTVVILQPSSPSRNRATYVQTAVDHLHARVDHSAVVSVVPWRGDPPSKACTLTPEGYLQVPQTHESRHLQPRHYRRDGTVYAVRTAYARSGDLYGPSPVPLLVDPADSVTVD